MASLLQVGLMNAGVVVLLALLVTAIGCRLRRPALLHALWILVLAKLITPPLFEVAIELPAPVDSPAWSAPVEGRSHAVNAEGTMQPGDPEFARSVGPSGIGLPRSSGESEETRLTWFRSTTVLMARNAVKIVNDGTALARDVWRQRPAWLWLAVCLAWGLGSGMWFARQAWRIWRFQQRLLLAVPAPSAIQQQTAQLASQMGLRRCPDVIVISEVLSPMLSGVFRTRLVFPKRLLERLDETSRGTLLAHELAHFARGDQWVRALELVVTGLYWWHPVVWWARRRIEACEEECCDAWVVTQSRTSPRVYAEALLETIDFLAGAKRVLPPIATGLGQVPFLKHRLKSIMRGVAPCSMSYPARLAVVIVASAVLPLHPAFSRATMRVTAPPPTIEAAVESILDQPVLTEIPRTPAGHRAGEGSVPPGAAAAGSAAPPAAHTARIAKAPARPSAPPANWATATSADGRFTITQTARGAVVLHDAITGRTTDLGDAQILSVAFAPDGRHFATGGADSSVRIWDPVTAETLALLSAHGDAVQTVAFSPDGGQLCSGARNGEICLWQFVTRELVTQLSIDRAPINSVAISRDGKLLAAAAGSWQSLASGHVTVWNLHTRERQSGFALDSAVGAVAFHEDRASLVASDWKGQVTIWNLESGALTGVGFIPKDVIAAAPFFVDTPLLSRVAPIEIPALNELPWSVIDLKELIGEFSAPARARAVRDTPESRSESRPGQAPGRSRTVLPGER